MAAKSGKAITYEALISAPRLKVAATRMVVGPVSANVTVTVSPVADAEALGLLGAHQDGAGSEGVETAVLDAEVDDAVEPLGVHRGDEAVVTVDPGAGLAQLDDVRDVVAVAQQVGHRRADAEACACGLEDQV